ncbi:MAG: HlyD family efflux transporter periplasmic adaptor subunit [Alphaproteobacteria bacterium]
MLAVGMATYGPGLFNTISSNAILNAPTVPVLSPIEGIVTRIPVTAGAEISANTVLAEIVNATADTTFLHQLQTEIETIRGRLAASLALDAELAALQEQLHQEFDRYRNAAVARAKAQLDESHAALAAATILTNDAEREYDRKQILARSGIVATAAVQAAESNLARLQAEAMRAKANLDRSHRDLDAVRAGTFVTDQGQDVPYSSQRADELAVRRADATAQRSELLVRRSEVERLIAIESARADQKRHAVIRAPRDGVVWRLNVVEGSRVAADTPIATLINCNEIIVQAQFPGRRFEDVQPGTSAEVRVLGSNGVRQARTRDVRAMGASERADNLAAPAPTLVREQFLATFSLERPQGDADRDTHSFCEAGRGVEVTMGKRVSPIKTILLGFEIMASTAFAAER